MKKESRQIRSRYFSSRQAWRSWLKTHHAREQAVWVLLYKKRLSRGISYEEAVEEALCFGWIDGQLRRVDDQRHVIRFSPRRKGSVWAPSNVARIRRLIKEKKMTPAGMAVYDPAKVVKAMTPTVRTTRRIVLPTDLRAALVANRKAWMHFQNYPKSFRLLAAVWVSSAKKNETRLRRIRAVVQNAEAHPRPRY